MTDTKTPKRPTRICGNGIIEAAREIATDLARAGQIPSGETEEGIAAEIAHVGEWHMNGYELAKELDNRYSWDIDADIVETLDGWSHVCRKQLIIIQRKWVEENDITPPYPDGTRVRARYGGDWVDGKIDGVYGRGVAQYLIDLIPPMPNKGRAIVYFEHVEPTQ